MYIHICTIYGLHFGEPNILTHLDYFLGHIFLGFILFTLLSLPLPKVLRVIARENDKTRVCSTYVSKIDLNVKQPRISKSKVHFNEIKRSMRFNPDVPMQELDPNDRMDTDEDNDTESTSSSKSMDIIGQTPNKLNMSINDYDFENISLGSHDYTLNSDAKIEELYRIPSHVRLIEEFLSNKEKLEYYLTSNFE